MQNIEDTTAGSSSVTLLNLIDLTKKTPSSSTLRSRRTCTENISVYSVLERTNHPRKRTLNTNQIQEHHAHKKIIRNNPPCNDEIVTLNDTIYIEDDDDDDKHYVTGSDNGEPISLTCPICFELLCSKLKPTTTRCGHIFCAQCLKTFLSKSKKCPTCKATVTLKSCTRLFL